MLTRRSPPFLLLVRPSKRARGNRELQQRRQTSTESDAFSLLIHLGSTEFLALSVFTVTETVCPKMWEKPPAKNAKSLLPFDARRSKTCLLKLAIKEIKSHVYGKRQTSDSS